MPASKRYHDLSNRKARHLLPRSHCHKNRNNASFPDNCFLPPSYQAIVRRKCRQPALSAKGRLVAGTTSHPCNIYFAIFSITVTINIQYLQKNHFFQPASADLTQVYASGMLLSSIFVLLFFHDLYRRLQFTRQPADLFGCNNPWSS